MKSRILYEWHYPYCHVMIFRNDTGRVVVLCENGVHAMIQYADEGYELNDDTALTLATVYSIMFEKTGESA